MSHTPYVDFVTPKFRGDHHISRVGCVKCNDTIGTKDADGKPYFWDHKRDVRVELSNGTLAYLPVCSTCFTSITPDDFPTLEKTLHYGWAAEKAFLEGGDAALDALSAEVASDGPSGKRKAYKEYSPNHLTDVTILRRA